MNEEDVNELVEILRHYLSQMRPEHRDAALRQLGKEYLLECTGGAGLEEASIADIAAALEWAFDWELSDEGHTYWADISDIYRNFPCEPYDPYVKLETELPAIPADETLYGIL